jgi:hypothetical protein
MLKFLSYFNKLLTKNFYYDFGDYRNTVLLTGTGRSGTTWVEDIINYRNTYRIIFEPFYPQKINFLSNFSYRQYLRVDSYHYDYAIPIKRILSGKFRNSWVDRYNNKFVVKKRLIKDIRSHFFIKWIKVYFPEIPQIFLIRHPCAVANSKLNLKWKSHVSDLISQDELVNDYLHPFIEDIIRINNKGTDFDKHILQWCIENYVPLRQFLPEEILILFYESICMHPEFNIKSILGHINEEYNPSALKMLNKPSALSRDCSPIRSGNDIICTWRNYITPDQAKSAFNICKIFGLHQIYNYSDLPEIEADKLLSIF